MTRPLPPDTLPGYFTRSDDGKLVSTDKLEQLYEKIREKVFDGKDDYRGKAASVRPDAFLLYVAGGNGVGKSTWLEIAKNRGVVPRNDAPNAIYMLNQFFKDHIPEMLAIYDKDNPGHTRLSADQRMARIKERDDAYWFSGGEALAVYFMQRLTHEAFERGLTVIFDSQMAYKDQHLSIIEDAKVHDYPAIQIGVFIDPENYPRRIFKRMREQGRPTEFRTHLSRQGRFAQLYCEAEQSSHVFQHLDDKQRFVAGSNGGPSAPCYLDLFDASILTSNNLDLDKMQPGDAAYNVVAISQKQPDGKVVLSIRDPVEYDLLRKISRIDIDKIHDDWNEEQLRDYLRSLKTLPPAALGSIRVDDSVRPENPRLQNKPGIENNASRALISFVEKVLGDNLPRQLG